MSRKVCVKIGPRMFHKSVRKVRDNEVTFDTNHKSSYISSVERLRSTKPVDKVNKPLLANGLDSKTI